MVTYTPAQIADSMRNNIPDHPWKNMTAEQVSAAAEKEKSAVAQVLDSISGFDGKIRSMIKTMYDAGYGIQAFADAKNRRYPRRVIAKFLSTPEYSHHEDDISEIYFAVNVWLSFFGEENVPEEWDVCPYCSSPMKDYVCTNADCKTRSYRAFKDMLKLGALLLAAERGETVQLPDFCSKIKDSSEFDLAFIKPIKGGETPAECAEGMAALHDALDAAKKSAAAGVADAVSTAAEKTGTPAADSRIDAINRAAGTKAETKAEATAPSADARLEALRRATGAKAETPSPAVDSRIAAINRAAGIKTEAPAAEAAVAVSMADAINRAAAARMARDDSPEETTPAIDRAAMINSIRRAKEQPVAEAAPVKDPLVADEKPAKPASDETPAKPAFEDIPVKPAADTDAVKKALENIGRYMMRLQSEAAGESPDFDGILAEFMDDSLIGEAMATGSDEVSAKVNEVIALGAQLREEAAKREADKAARQAEKERRIAKKAAEVAELREKASAILFMLEDESVPDSHMGEVVGSMDLMSLYTAIMTDGDDDYSPGDKAFGDVVHKVVTAVKEYIGAVSAEREGLTERCVSLNGQATGAAVYADDAFETYRDALAQSVRDGRGADGAADERENFILALADSLEMKEASENAEADSYEKCLSLRRETAEKVRALLEGAS